MRKIGRTVYCFLAGMLEHCAAMGRGEMAAYVGNNMSLARFTRFKVQEPNCF
jgi:hypothetical protein